MSLIQELSLKLADASYEGFTFNCLPLKGETEVLQVLVSGLDEMPIFVTATETQLLCITYLFKKEELKQDKLTELNQTLLEMSIPMPLSAFAMVEDHYVIYGALSPTSTFDNVTKELVTLARNASDSMEAFEDYLN